MKIYTLYYYDRPFLKSWLEHYCHIPCIDEILIQNQNWSQEDTLYLLDTVADYIDRFNKKICVLPSNYVRPKEPNKRLQFMRVGQPRIRNRVLQFLQNSPFILGAPDEAIYGGDYEDTNNKLIEFEEFSKKKNVVGYIPIFTACKNGFFEGQFCQKHLPCWKARVFRFHEPFKHTGASSHDNTISILRNNRWTPVVHRSGYNSADDIKGFGVDIPLRLLHYQRLVRPTTESAQFIPVRLDQIPCKDLQPEHYLKNLVS